MIQAAVIGLGNVGWEYDCNQRDGKTRTHLKALLDNDEVNVVAVCDSDPAKKHKLPVQLKSIAYYPDINELLASEQIDLLSICSPTALHFAHWTAAQAKNIPMIWLEKPAFASVEEYQQALKNPKGTVLVNYIRRYDKRFWNFKQLIDSGEIGKVLVVNLTYSRGLVVNGTHLLDYILYLFNFKDSHLENLHLLTKERFVHFVFTLGGIQFDLKGLETDHHVLDIEVLTSEGRAGLYQNGRELRVEKKAPNENFPGFYRLKTIHQESSDELGTNFNEILQDLIGAHQTKTQPRSNLDTAFQSLQLTMMLNDLLK